MFIVLLMDCLVKLTFLHSIQEIFHIGDNKFSNEGFDDKKVKFWKHYNDSVLGLK
jgi:hypothetical protein